jgi:hypothetical protein
VITSHESIRQAALPLDLRFWPPSFFEKAGSAAMRADWSAAPALSVRICGVSLLIQWTLGSTRPSTPTRVSAPTPPALQKA